MLLAAAVAAIARSDPAADSVLATSRLVEAGHVTGLSRPLEAARRAFAWGRVNLVRSIDCGWPMSTYMIGLQQYYAATAAAGAADSDARSDLVEWGRSLRYELCTINSTAWTGPCASASFTSCADNQLAAATYIELYVAGLDLPIPHSDVTLRSTIAEFDAEIVMGAAAEGSWPIVDLTYIAMAPLARLGAVTGEPKYFAKMFKN